MKPQQLVLDAYALMVFFEDEPAADQVEKVLIKAEKGDLELFLTMINLGELFYIFERESGEISAQQMLATIDGLPIAQLEPRKSRRIIQFPMPMLLLLRQRKSLDVR